MCGGWGVVGASPGYPQDSKKYVFVLYACRINSVLYRMDVSKVRMTHP